MVFLDAVFCLSSFFLQMVFLRGGMERGGEGGFQLIGLGLDLLFALA